MSSFRSTTRNCFSEASSVLSGIKSELSNWNDDKAIPVKDYIEKIKNGFQTVCNMINSVEEHIKKMQESADKVERITRKNIE